MEGKTRIFFVFCLILFILFIWGRTETQGDGGYSVYVMEKAITKSGKVIPLGWKFQGPIGDPVVSFKITIEIGGTERVDVGINLAAANRQ